MLWHSFLLCRGNFELAMGGLESNVSIFQKTAMSCLEICEIRNETPNEFFSHYTILLSRRLLVVIWF